MVNHRITRSALTATIFAGAIGIAGITTATPALAATTYGVDMQRACSTQWPSSWALQAQVTNPSNAYSWRCVAPFNRSTYGIDVNAACASQHPGTSARLGNTRNPYSWYCQ